MKKRQQTEVSKLSAGAKLGVRSETLEMSLGDVMRMVLILSIALVVALAGSSILFGQPTDALGERNLAGDWELDNELSDDPVEKMLEAMEGRARSSAGAWGSGGLSGGGSGVGAGGGGFGSGRGPGRRGGFGDDRSGPLRSQDEAIERLRRMASRKDFVEISHEVGGSLTLSFADGTADTFTTDGKKNRLSVDGQTVEVHARWKKSALVVTSRSKEQQMIETYQVSGDRKLLKIRVEVGGLGAGGPLTFQRLYRPRATASPDPG